MKTLVFLQVPKGRITYFYVKYIVKLFILRTQLYIIIDQLLLHLTAVITFNLRYKCFEEYRKDFLISNSISFLLYVLKNEAVTRA